MWLNRVVDDNQGGWLLPVASKLWLTRYVVQASSLDSAQDTAQNYCEHGWCIPANTDKANGQGREIVAPISQDPR